MPLPSDHQVKHALKAARYAARPYWGTIVGSAVGLALAGPFGLLAGAGFGYWLHDAPEGMMPPMGPPPGWQPPPPEAGEYQEGEFKADELQKVEPPPPSS